VACIASLTAVTARICASLDRAGAVAVYGRPHRPGPARAPPGRLRVPQPPPAQRESARPLLGHPEHCGKLVKLDAVHLADEYQPGDVALA
jgi:hypothetical protein